MLAAGKFIESYKLEMNPSGTRKLNTEYRILNLVPDRGRRACASFCRGFLCARDDPQKTFFSTNVDGNPPKNVDKSSSSIPKIHSIHLFLKWKTAYLRAFRIEK